MVDQPRAGRTDENGYADSNRGGFHDAEIDRLHERALTSLDPRERDQAWIAANRRFSELTAWGPLLYQGEIILAKNRVRGPVGNYGAQQGITWNVFEWEVAGD